MPHSGVKTTPRRPGIASKSNTGRLIDDPTSRLHRPAAALPAYSHLPSSCILPSNRLGSDLKTIPVKRHRPYQSTSKWAIFDDREKHFITFCSILVIGFLALLIYTQVKKPVLKCNAILPPPGAPTSTSPTQDQTGLAAHNAFRALYGVPKLVW